MSRWDALKPDRPDPEQVRRSWRLKQAAEGSNLDELVDFGVQNLAHLADEDVFGVLIPRILEQPTCRGLKGLESLVRECKSAILAPLVEAVSEKGEETLRPNPLRDILLEKLPGLLQEDGLQVQAAECLIVVLDACRELEGVSSRTEVDPSLVVDLTCRDVGLRLMVSLVKRCPSCVSSVTSKLLFGYSNTSRTSLSSCRCGYAQGTNGFLDTLHEDARAVDCADRLVSGAAWSLWLPTPRTRSMSLFQQRVVASLEGLIRIATCKMYPDLVRALLLSVPFGRVPSVDAAMDELVHVSLMALARPQREKCLLEAFMVALGGHESPRGGIVPMATSIAKYLDSDRGRHVTRTRILDDIELLRACLRTKPGLVLDDTQAWDRFCGDHLSSASMESTIKCGASLRTIEALLSGRLDFPLSQHDATLDRVLVDHLCTQLHPDRVPEKHRLQLLACFAKFRPTDWHHLDQSSGALADTLKPLLLLVSDSQLSGKRRAEACRYVAGVCESFFACDTGSLPTVFTLTCSTVDSALADDNSGVRSMAVFALGNIASSLLDSGLAERVDLTVFVSSAPVLLSMLSGGEDEKVVNNTIRTSGHMFRLILRYDVEGIPNDWSSSVMSVIVDFIEASWRQPRADLTWKRRSAIRKHGWGACNALASIFGDYPTGHPSCMASFEAAVVCLLGCMEVFETMHEKLMISVATALTRVGGDLLLSVGDGQIARVVSTFIACSREGLLPRKIETHARRTAAHLVNHISVEEAATLFRMIPDAAHLFEFMDEEDCSSFETLARATKSPGVQLDVDLEIRFMNRAMRSVDLNDEL